MKFLLLTFLFLTEGYFDDKEKYPKYRQVDPSFALPVETVVQTVLILRHPPFTNHTEAF